MDLEELKESIRAIPDFPKPGIMFRDITTLLRDPDTLKHAVHELKCYCMMKNIDAIAGIESRGFILGSIIAHELGVGFIPIRKQGKLPADSISESYSLEYGNNTLEIHTDAVREGDKILIIDDLLATGGTASAAARLIERLDGKVSGLCFLIELTDLGGRSKLDGYDIFSLLQYD